MLRQGPARMPRLYQCGDTASARPAAIVTVGAATKLRTLIPANEAMPDTGMMALSDVTGLRLQKGSQSR